MLRRSTQERHSHDRLGVSQVRPLLLAVDGDVLLLLQRIEHRDRQDLYLSGHDDGAGSSGCPAADAQYVAVLSGSARSAWRSLCVSAVRAARDVLGAIAESVRGWSAGLMQLVMIALLVLALVAIAIAVGGDE
jgi:hypothetical protein